MLNTPHRLIYVVAANILVTACIAQQRLSVPRADGHITPLLVYEAQGARKGCAPLAVISHGAGGSEDGYRYLARSMAQQGYTTIVMGHRESGLQALRANMRADGMLAGVRAVVADPKAETARLLDVSAALDWADKQCHAPYRVLLGHSMGSETVMLEAGARNAIGVPSPPAGQDRFDAYVALSPEGPGVVFSNNAWSDIHKPIFILTGTRDQSLKGGPKARQIPWHDLPGSPRHCQWMGVIDGATHMNFAGSGLGHDAVEQQVTQTIAEFLSATTHPTRSCMVPASTASMALQAK